MYINIKKDDIAHVIFAKITTFKACLLAEDARLQFKKIGFYQIRFFELTSHIWFSKLSRFFINRQMFIIFMNISITNTSTNIITSNGYIIIYLVFPSQDILIIDTNYFKY